MTDLANLSETQRQGEATRAALGVQMRVRPLWSGAGRFTGITTRYVSPYRLRGKNSPDYLFENISHDGTVYVAEEVNHAGYYAYTSTDLKAWTVRTVDGSAPMVFGSLVAAPSLMVTKTTYLNYYHYRTSVDHGVTWVLQGTIANADVLCAAGGLVYLFGGASVKAFKTITAATPAGVERNFLTAQRWRLALHNGARTLVLNDDHSVGEWSANGLDGWNSAAGLPGALENMPAGSRKGYAVGGRFFITTIEQGTLSTIYSTDAVAWKVGAMGEMEPNGLRVVALGKGAELEGVLYVTASLTDGTSYWNAILATADGVAFKWLPPIMKDVTNGGVPSICARVDGSGLVFNGSGLANTTPALRYETNPNAQEVYLAV